MAESTVWFAVWLNHWHHGFSTLWRHFGIVLTTLLVALQDFWLGFRVLIAALLVQQFFENLVAPRILGSFTGLNPVWILISLLTGARIGGLLGVIVAVPIAVVIKTALSAVRRSRNVVPEGESPVVPVPTADLSTTQVAQ